MRLLVVERRAPVCVADISLITFSNLLMHAARGRGLVICLGEFHHACHVHKLADERIWVRKVINVIVLELVKRSDLGFLIDNNRQD